MNHGLVKQSNSCSFSAAAVLLVKQGHCKCTTDELDHELTKSKMIFDFVSLKIVQIGYYTKILFKLKGFVKLVWMYPWLFSYLIKLNCRPLM